MTSSTSNWLQALLRVNQIYVRENIVDDSNSIFQLQPSSTERQTLLVLNDLIQFLEKNINKMVFRAFFIKDSRSVTYQRSVLTFLDCCGFIGGVNEILHLFGMLISIIDFMENRLFIVFYQCYIKSATYEDQHKKFDSNQFEVYTMNILVNN